MVELPSYPMPSDEAERLIALASYKSPGSGPERSLDVILRHVRRVFGVPIAIVSFVEIVIGGTLIGPQPMLTASV